MKLLSLQLLLWSIQFRRGICAPAPQDAQPSTVPFEAPIPAITEEMKSDICGRFQGETVPADTRNIDNWKKYNMDQWIRDTLKDYQSRGWKLSSTSSSPAADLQSIFMHAAGPEGGNKCGSLLTACALQLDYNLCVKNPFSHFALEAMESYHNYLFQVSRIFDNSHQLILGFTGQVKEQFFTPLVEPNKLIVPLSIAGGIAAIFTAVAPWAKWLALPAAIAGTMSIINGVATQDALNIPQPLDQWEQVQTAITKLWEQVVKALDGYQKKQLRSPLPTVGSGTDYVEDTVQAPWIWKEGRFASPWALEPFEAAVVGVMATSAINSLWVSDGIVVIKITNEVWNQPNGQKICEKYSKVSVCINNVAYLVVRWRKEQATIGNPKTGNYPLDASKWWAWGAYDEGSGAENAKNADHLKDYNLTLEAVVKSAEKTQSANGFLYNNQEQNTINSISKDPSKLTLDNLLEWNLPVCDVEAIMKGKGFNKFKRGKKPMFVTDPPGGDDDTPLWMRSVPCTCWQAKGWPKNDYPMDSKLDLNIQKPINCQSWDT